MDIRRHVLLELLGLCEHCGTLVFISDYAEDDTMDTEWLCQCKGNLTPRSFGFDRGSSGAQKVRWVSPAGKWVDKKSTEDFKLDDVNVVVRVSNFFKPAILPQTKTVGGRFSFALQKVEHNLFGLKAL